MARLKKHIECTSENKAYIESLPKIYLIGCWARYGIRECANTLQVDKEGIPLVYNYNDHNGCYEEYELVPIHRVTTGQVYAWSTSEKAARHIADLMNEAKEMSRRGENGD